jgi:hypothetical protein
VKTDIFLENIICVIDETPNFLVVITGLALMHWIWITVLGIAQICQIAVDITTYEAIRGEKRGILPTKLMFDNFFDVMMGRPSFNDRKET